MQQSRKRTLFQPLWIEGAAEQGINEKLFISAKACFAIHISIGNVSYNNPMFYYEYSRPKQIRLFVENSFSIEVDLEDTPNYQMIYLPNPLRADDIMELEILDVYPGTKYKDTSINNVYFDRIAWLDFNLAVHFDYIPWQDWLNKEWFISKEEADINIIDDELNGISTYINITENESKTFNAKSGRIWIWLIFLLIITLAIFLFLYKVTSKKGF